MAEPRPDALRGRRLLVIEDDYLIAAALERALEDRGAEVVGPAGSVEGALRLVEAEGDRLDGAVLDINLRDERVYPVADALAARGVPFVFLTGYDAQVIPDTYAGVPRSEKPVSTALLARTLLKAGMR
jgi:ActR/RegA family two-component response regulator